MPRSSSSTRATSTAPSGAPPATTASRAHLADAKSRPVTKTDPAVCGACHENQFRTMYTMNPEKTARKSKTLAAGPSPNPAFDKLMAPHGFTREHNEPRSHAFMLYDQYVVDRAFGGRFENKEGWRGLAQFGGNFKVWDVIEDKYPGQDHKPFKPGTAAAANPVCMSCKTADHILDWAYLGDPVPGAKWSRTSKVQEFVKDTNHALNCFFCHDPHSAKPRVIRDGLIQALTRPEKDTLWHKDAARREDRGEGLRPARLHAQDRHARPLRHEPAVRPVPRRVQLQPGHRPDDGQAHRHDRLAHQPLPVQEGRRHRPALHGPQVPRLQARDHGRAAVEGAAPGRRELLRQQAPEGRRRVLELPHAEGQGREDGQDLHLALADLAQALHQGDLPHLPQPVEAGAGRVRDRFA